MPVSSRTLARASGLTLLTLTLIGCGDTSQPPVVSGTPITSLADDGPGSFRETLAAAKDGDTLRFTTQGTVTVASTLVVDKNITLLAEGVTFDAAGKGRVFQVPAGADVTIRGGTLKGGTGAPITVASVSKQDLTVATYGGVLLNEGTLTLDGTAVTDGKANLGGGIANVGGTLILKIKSTVSGNRAVALPANETESSGLGGGIYNTGTLNMEAGTVSNNSAFYSGGGIRTTKTGNMTISGGLITSNQCTSPVKIVDKTTTDGCEGGGILTTGPITMSGGTVRGNTSTRFGGGLEVVGTTFNLSGGDISANTAFEAGGGVLVSSTTVNYSGGTIQDNKVTDPVDSGGGGILSYKSIFKMSGGIIKGNSARIGGGH